MAKNAYNTLEIGRLSTRQARRLTVAAVSCVSETMQAYVQESSSTGLSKARLASIDAYRGLVMFLMLAEVLRFSAVSDARPGSVFWRFLCDQQTHAAWTGCSLHDLIQPGFFLSGWGGTSIFDRPPPVKRTNIQLYCQACCGPLVDSRCAGHDHDRCAPAALDLVVRRHSHSDRPGPHIAVAAWLPSGARSVDRAWRYPGLVTGCGSRFPRCRARVLTMPWLVSLLTG
jgi:hypothetical protein